jgi:hypothetical protein
MDFGETEWESRAGYFCLRTGKIFRGFESDNEFLTSVNYA